MTDLDFTPNGRPLWYDFDEQPTTIAVADLLLTDPRRRVAETDLGPFYISTVFLVTDHSMGLAPQPVLYETMVFVAPWLPRYDPLGDLDNDYERYSTRREAEHGHAMFVALTRRVLLTRLALPAGSIAPTT